MIPRAPPTSQIASPYQSGQKGAVVQNGSMLDKLKLFKVRIQFKRVLALMLHYPVCVFKRDEHFSGK